jgi:hypothetical protein
VLRVLAFSLVAFCFVTYGVLAWSKRPNDFDNFAYEITFG